MASLQTLNNTALVSLLLLSFLGLWGTWGIGGRTGFLGLIKDTLDAPVQKLPVVSQPVHQTTTIIGTLSQTITYCTIVPFYLFLHVLTSPTNLGPSSAPSNGDPAQDFLIDPAELAAWAPAFALSYLLPTFLVMLPSPKYTSWTIHQYIMAWWELYPIPFKILQLLLSRYIFARIYASSSPPPLASTSLDQKKKASASRSQPTAQKDNRKSQNLHLLRYTYLTAFAVAVLTHTITLTLSLSAYFFPSLFSSAPSASSPPPFSLHPKNIFIPVSPLYHTPINNLGEGLYHFLVWNMQVSNIAPLVWGLLQLRNAVERKGKEAWEGWAWAGAKVLGCSVVGGPSAGAVWCVWKRDELVLGGTEVGIGKKES
ncbi:MAG: hypothetical protein Q9225_005280 [Loekoesia sp. 1 TL-2023]